MKRQWILTGVSAVLVCCLFVFMPAGVYAAQSSNVQFYKTFIFPLAPSTATGTSDATIYASLMCTVFQGVRVPTNETSDYFEVISLHKFIVRNTLDTDIMINKTYLQLMFRASSTGASIELQDLTWLDGQLMVDRGGTGGILYFSNAPEYCLQSNIVVPAGSDIACVFKVKWKTTEASLGNLTFNTTYVYMYEPMQSNFRYTTGSWHTSYESYLPDIYEALGGQTDEAGDVNEQAQDVNDEMEDMHETETAYYDQAQDDVETAFTGFSFSTSDRTAVGVVTQQFTDVWSKFPAVFMMVPVTGLSLKLATTILRHAPRGRRKKNGESD